jgi:hypothetical protein
LPFSAKLGNHVLVRDRLAGVCFDKSALDRVDDAKVVEHIVHAAVFRQLIEDLSDGLFRTHVPDSHEEVFGTGKYTAIELLESPSGAQIEPRFFTV